MNWLPLSEVRVSGTPILEIQVEINALTQDSAVKIKKLLQAISYFYGSS